METKHLKKYAPEARREFITAVKNKAAVYGLLPKQILPMKEEGDVVIIGDRPFPRSVAKQRKELEDRIKRDGFQQFIEAVAYTWFNRFVAIRYMELHGYLDHGYRVLSHPEGKSTPEILENAERIELPGLNRDAVVDLKLDGSKDEQLYQMLLLAQCNALHKAMPFLFESIKDGTELLLPDNLLHTDSLVRTLVNDIPEDQWENVEIIGWLYQFYISEKKDEVIGKVVKSEDIPAATQLFTPNWIVKYLVQNSLGRQWLATYPDSPLKQQMEFYIEPAEQTPEVQQQLDEITPDSLNPEELTLLDPACGSGHILVEAYDLFKAIYTERGYRARDIPKLILVKNLFGLEIDDRAAQLAAFALMMKARADDRGIFRQEVQPNVMAIRESTGIDSHDIADSLNRPLPDGTDGQISSDDIDEILGLFKYGTVFGALITIPSKLKHKLLPLNRRVDEVIANGGLLEQSSARTFSPFLQQAIALSQQHDAVVLNPPYMGNKYQDARLKEFCRENYSDAKSDLFACFIDRARIFAGDKGIAAMITRHGWMFISSYDKFRERLLTSSSILTMAHLGPSAFSEISGEVVQATAFVLLPVCIPHWKPTFFRLVGGDSSDKQEGLLSRKHRFRSTQQDRFTTIPGNPVAYWVPDAVISSFSELPSLGEITDIRQGMSTGNGDLYVRCWHEVDRSRCALPNEDKETEQFQDCKWFPYNKGGKYRKWYGNKEFVLNFENDGADMRAAVASGENRGYRMVSREFFFKPGITWSDIGSGELGARLLGPGFIFENTGSMVFSANVAQEAILGFLCSRLTSYFMTILNPTLHFTVGEIKKLPFNIAVCGSPEFIENVRSLVAIAKADWDYVETSWDFRIHPLLESNDNLLASSYMHYERRLLDAITRSCHLESENNKLLTSSYGVQDELLSDVSASQVTLHSPNREEDIRRMISYSTGCMMGRYSLDQPGLTYAQCGNEGFNSAKYNIFPADDDGIVPITDVAWFPDDAANRFADFIKTAWPKEHLEENLMFVAESLGQKKGETSRDCIRRYFATGFYKHHLSMYKKRPIYWLFSSGKQRAFQCLVYLQRYNAGTLSRMRTEYVVPLQGKMNARIEQLESDIPAASSTSHRKKLEKERDSLIKQREELQTFDEKLRHYADQRIELDLDDGVKVNYGKFGDLLAEVKAITGGKDDE